MLDAGTALLIVLTGTMVIAGSLVARTQATVDRAGIVIVAGLTALVAIPSFLQLAQWPKLESWLGRDETKIVHHGQIWRLGTSIVVQDGGWAGAISNVTFLLGLSLFAVRLLGPRRLVVAFGLGALAGEVAGLWWQPTGAGNSVGNCGIAAAVLVYAVTQGPLPWRIAAGIVIALGGTLPSHQDIHGAAFVTTGVVLLVWRLRWEQPAATQPSSSLEHPRIGTAG